MSATTDKHASMASRRFKPYPTYKDSGVEWLGDVPAAWKLQPLWTMFRRVKLAGHPDEELLSVYRDFGVIPKASRDDNFNRPSEDLSTYQLVRKRDLVTNKMKAWQGSIAISEYTGIVSPAYHVYSPLHQETDRYLHHLLRSSPYVSRYMQLSKGIRVSQWDLEPEAFSRILVLLPSLSEQSAIVTLLDRETARINALVAKKEQLIELLQEERTTLITRAVTEGLDPSVPMKNSGIEWLGDIPAHWEIMKLGWLTECLDGRRVPLNAEERGHMRGEYPYWGANSIVDNVDAWLFDEDLVLLGEDGAPFFDRTKPVAFFVSGKIWVNNHVHVLRPGGRIDAAFLTHLLNCVDYRAFIDGTTRDKLTQGDMNSIPIHCPEFEEQRAIAALLDRETARIDALTEKVRDAIERLKEYRTALISAAVTGKIDVREEANLS